MSPHPRHGPRVAGLVLAAGAGRRLGTPKALVRGRDGVPWVAARAAALSRGGCAPVVVVLGAGAEQARALLPVGVVTVVAEDWVQGMGASLRAGLDALGTGEHAADGVQAVLVALVDTPGVTPEVVRRLVEVATPAALARASYRGQPGHPVLIGRDHLAGVRQAAVADRGARDYLAGRTVRAVECGDAGHGADVDTAEDAARHGVRW